MRFEIVSEMVESNYQNFRKYKFIKAVKLVQSIERAQMDGAMEN